MTDLVPDIIAGALAGAASGLAVLRGSARRAGRVVLPAVPSETAPPDPTPDPEPVPAPQATATPEASPAAPETLTKLLPTLSRALSPLVEDLDHPGDMLDLAEFQAVVAAFRRPDATFALLSQYALGTNWPLACAAFIVLADHPDRQAMRDRVMGRIEGIRPFVLLFALRFLTTLPDRPPAGATLLSVPAWWQNNPVIPGFYLEYFETSQALGDQPGFGGALAAKAEFDAAPTEGLLQKIEHPFAERLLQDLRRWASVRIDRAYLSTVGTVWDGRRDPLLVAPPAWEALLTAAEAAIRQDRPRSVLVSGDTRTGKTAFIRLLGAAVAGRRLDGVRHQRQRVAGGPGLHRPVGGPAPQDRRGAASPQEGRMVRQRLRADRQQRHAPGPVRQHPRPAPAGGRLPGQLVLITEATQAAATRVFQARPSLRTLIEVLTLEAMTEADALALAGQVAARTAAASGVAVPPAAVAKTLELALGYMGSAQLPGAVLELLTRAVNRAVTNKEATLTAGSVIATLSQASGLPVAILDAGQRVELAGVQDFFARRVIGQDEAVRAVVDRIAMLKAGLTDPRRPTAVFLFAGPTGTGKTELAKTLAEYLFGSADRMARLDMSEFQAPEATSKIVGQRNDRGTDSLISRIRKQPFSVILLDEFEKAHPNCWDLFLQIFDDGRLSDADGSEADFRHCFIILTSNLGATAHRGGGLGFVPGAGAYGQEQVLRAVAQTFRPEFVNRLDKIIVFRPLTRELMRSVLHKELAAIQERRGLRDRGWAVEWEASAIEFLLDRGFSAEMGARPLKRAIDQLLLGPLAATLVEHRFPEGDQFLFVRSNGTAIEVEFVDPDAEPPGEAEPDGAEGGLSLPAIVLRQTGSVEERASLTASWRDICATLEGGAWTAARDGQRLALADPGIWSREDRFRVFADIAMADRLTEAARTAERLFNRYTSAGEGSPRASRELAARLALQLHNIRQGLDDVAAHAPVDALLRVDPALDASGDSTAAAAWCGRVTSMYRAWAGKRRMQLEEIAPISGSASPVLHVTGFGAFRTLLPEAGLHVLDDPAVDGARRTVARVLVVGGPTGDLPKAGRLAAASRLLAACPVTAAIIRRYRDDPAPVVRDSAGWRTGRLEAVLGGDFDLMGALRSQAAE